MTLIPDFDAIRNKRINDLTREELDDARELWLRQHYTLFASGSAAVQEGVNWIEFLIKRLDETRVALKRANNLLEELLDEGDVFAYSIQFPEGGADAFRLSDWHDRALEHLDQQDPP